jgi:hypothetical protein
MARWRCGPDLAVRLELCAGRSTLRSRDRRRLLESVAELRPFGLFIQPEAGVAAPSNNSGRDVGDRPCVRLLASGFAGSTLRRNKDFPHRSAPARELVNIDVPLLTS